MLCFSVQDPVNLFLITNFAKNKRDIAMTLRLDTVLFLFKTVFETQNTLGTLEELLLRKKGNIVGVHSSFSSSLSNEMVNIILRQSSVKPYTPQVSAHHAISAKHTPIKYNNHI